LGCDIVIEDGAVSPRHASLVVSAGGLTVTDLGSPGGVLVNGARVASETPLSHGDQVAFGECHFEVIADEQLDDDSEDEGRPTLVETLAPASAAPDENERNAAFRVLAGVIDKALALDNIREVAPMISSQFDRLASDCEAGRSVPNDTVTLASGSAAKLAAATGSGYWVNVLVRVHYARGEVLPVELVDTLYVVLRRVRGVDWALLGDYVELLRSRSGRMSPAERFASSRIEGLLQLGPG
jgi:hypothetical protein